MAPITPAHAAVLAHLGRDTSLSIAELARRAGVTRQTMHRAVTQLVDEGLLVSTPGPGFPRSTLIGLTDEGSRRRDVASAILRDLEQVLDSRLGPGAVVELRDSLSRAWPRLKNDRAVVGAGCSSVPETTRPGRIEENAAALGVHLDDDAARPPRRRHGPRHELTAPVPQTIPR